eukprot:768541-Hanusia_phi.AAC.3
MRGEGVSKEAARVLPPGLRSVPFTGERLEENVGNVEDRCKGLRGTGGRTKALEEKVEGKRGAEEGEGRRGKAGERRQEGEGRRGKAGQEWRRAGEGF